MKARAQITLTVQIDIQSVWWYYKLQSSTAAQPAKPTTNPPSGWTLTEPPYTEASTNTLYFVELTVFTDGSFQYTDVSVDSSYEAAKAAWNKANVAQDAATNAQTTADRAQETANAAQETADDAQERLTASYNDLHALIIKTADDVRSEMDVVEAQLRSEYIAKSEWGAYEEGIHQDIVATAENTVEKYGYEARLDALDEQATGFDQYIIASNGYIRRGIIGYDEGNMPIIGVAIGQDLRSTTVTIDGADYEQIDMTRNLATYTSDRVSFWINGVEMAYFSNAVLHVTRIDVVESITFEGVWELSRKYGFTLRWIGG